METIAVPVQPPEVLPENYTYPVPITEQPQAVVVEPIITTPDVGITPAPLITSIEELRMSHAAIVNQEAADTATFSVVLNESRETLRGPLFQWAAEGFKDGYCVHSITVTPPHICSDGVVRNFTDYMQYCLKKDMGAIMEPLQGLVTGIRFAFMIEGNTFKLVVFAL